jgi:hypothetical protein
MFGGERKSRSGMNDLMRVGPACVNRRGFLVGLAATIAAPTIVRPSAIMPIRGVRLNASGVYVVRNGVLRPASADAIAKWAILQLPGDPTWLDGFDVTQLSAPAKEGDMVAFGYDAFRHRRA